MGRAIKFKGEEGEIFNKWLESRLIKNNKNVLSAELGSTGSGKSYRDLRKFELWYKHYFKELAPVENICFGITSIVKRLDEGNLRKGEVLIMEEAGINLGSREWQNKISRMFNHILQSFRSMNIALFLNLPYLSMLDSQARHLLHYYGESVGVDIEKGTNKCKPFFLQVAQSTGKVYRHYPIIKLGTTTKKVKRFVYKKPSQYLIDAYEQKKVSYLKEVIKSISEKIHGKEKEKRPSELAFKCYDMWMFGKKKQGQIAEEIGKTQSHVSQLIKEAQKWTNTTKKQENRKENVGISTSYPLQPTP